MNAASFADISDLRRAMPRNALAMRVCDLAETALIAKPVATVSTQAEPREHTGCEACERRKAANAATMRRSRTKLLAKAKAD